MANSSSVRARSDKARRRAQHIALGLEARFAERRERLLAGRLKRFTGATVTDRAALEELLREGEKTGLAYDLEEHSVGICAVGTAFFDSIGREYSLSIPVPATRFEAKKQLLSKLLKKAKADLLEHIVAG